MVVSAENFISSFFSSPIAQVLLSVLLTSGFGAWLVSKIQDRSWRYQKEISDRDLERKIAENVFYDISRLMDKRLYRMRQLLWSLNRNNQVRITAKLVEYQKIVYEWNDNNNVNLSRIEQYFGAREREYFEVRISKDFIFIGMLLERWCGGRTDHPGFTKMFSMIDSLNALVYDFDKRLLLAIQTGQVGKFR